MSTGTDTRADWLRKLANDYFAEHGHEPASLAHLFQYARSNGWEPPQRSMAKLFNEEMRRALRDDYYKDPQGRSVRKKHAVVETIEGKQRSLWADIENAPPAHMHLSLQQRRGSIFRDVVQAKIDMDSYNENNNPDPSNPIQLSFDFNEDLAEAAEPSTYEEPPCEDDGEED